MDKSLGKMAEKFKKTRVTDIFVGIIMSPIFGVAFLAKFIASVNSSKL